MIYNIKRTDAEDIGLFSPLWDKAEKGIIKDGGWEGYAPSPESSFKILRSPKGFFVLMESAEKGLRAEIKEENGAVCTDSCLEFFISPCREDGRYLNFELNPKGVLHLGLGADRCGRTHIENDRSIFKIESSPADGNWKLKFFIPDGFLLSLFPEISEAFRGNVYKCGDKTDSPHYGSWNPVNSPVPDFHRPEYFGEFLTEK